MTGRYTADAAETTDREDADLNGYQAETELAEYMGDAERVEAGLSYEVEITGWLAGREEIPPRFVAVARKTTEHAVVFGPPNDRHVAQSLVDDGIGLPRFVVVPKSQICHVLAVRQFEMVRTFAAMKPAELDEEMARFLDDMIERHGYVKWADVMSRFERGGNVSQRCARLLAFCGFERVVTRLDGVQQRVWVRNRDGVTPLTHLFNESLLRAGAVVGRIGRTISETVRGCHRVSLSELRGRVQAEIDRRRAIHAREQTPVTAHRASVRLALRIVG